MKLFKYTTKEPVFHYGTDRQVEIPETYRPKPFRGMWVANVNNIDLPEVKDGEIYRQEIQKLLDTCQEFSINAIFFQVRTTNDAFYKSALNPYSRYLTGQEGKEPPFDVMDYVIQETKNRGIEFHAWCNPYRVSAEGTESTEKYFSSCDDLNFAKRHPEDCVLDKRGQIILNPALPEVKQFIIDTMREIVVNYAVDGIHFDDYFYPYHGLDENHDDKESFEAQSLPKGDFRRQNVNDVISGVYHAIKAVNPKLRFGISPFGIWKNRKENEWGSRTDPACTESYYALYADTLAWIEGGYVDYVVPQIYWDFGHRIAPFADICDFWVEVCRKHPVDLYIGHGAYRLGTEGEFANKKEITNQLLYANQFASVKGNVFFTYKTFVDKDKAFPGMQEVKKLLNGDYDEKT